MAGLKDLGEFHRHFYAQLLHQRIGESGPTVSEYEHAAGLCPGPSLARWIDPLIR